MIQVLVYGLLWILLMGVAIFATQNTLFVTIKFLAFESINLPLGLVLVFSAGLGAIAVTIWQNTQVAEFKPSMPSMSKQKSDRANYGSYSAYRASTSSASNKSTDTSTSTKSTSKNSQADDFDEEWDDDWG
jgi:uncharacterized integral membrane protein